MSYAIDAHGRHIQVGILAHGQHTSQGLATGGWNIGAWIGSGIGLGLLGIAWSLWESVKVLAQSISAMNPAAGTVAQRVVSQRDTAAGDALHRESTSGQRPRTQG